MQRRSLLKGGILLGSCLPFSRNLNAEAGSSKRTLVIDAHCHAGKGEEMSAPWSTYADPEVTLRRAAEVGIDKTILFPINNPSFEKANAELARIIERYPDKFIGFAKHDPVREAGRIKEMLTHEVRELGLKGLKLHHLPSREVLDAVAELRIPILYHPDRVSDFHMLATEYPQINFIVAHLGSFASHDYTEHLAAIDLAKRYPNVFLETSSVVFQEYLEMAARELPAEKLIFGTDGPLVDSRVELYKIRLLKLPLESETKVLAGNILRLLSMKS
jgi:predicted TIM-barrel fold metal-dependent hydrolase